MKNGGSDPDVVWHGMSDGAGMRQVVGFGDPSTGRGNLGGKYGAPITNGEFAPYICESA